MRLTCESKTDVVLAQRDVINITDMCLAEGESQIHETDSSVETKSLRHTDCC